MDKKTLIEVKGRELNLAISNYYDIIEMSQALITGEIAKIKAGGAKIEKLGNEILKLTETHG